MGLVFKGNPPSFSGDIKVEVPTPTYSGKKSSNSADSINPYTSQGPGEGGAGLTEEAITVLQGGTPSVPASANISYGASNLGFGTTSFLEDGFAPIVGATTDSINLNGPSQYYNFTLDGSATLSVFVATFNSPIKLESTDGGGYSFSTPTLPQSSWYTFPTTIAAGDYKMSGIGDTVLTEMTTLVPQVEIFNAIESDQTWTRPSGVTTVNVKLWGAGGGGSDWSSGQSGGSGGYTAVNIDVTNHATLTVKVGNGGTTDPITGNQGAGWEDGGDGANSNYAVYGALGGGGGGRTAIRNAANDTELATAGGGGGGGAVQGGYQGNDASQAAVGPSGTSFQGASSGLGTDGGGGGGGYVGGNAGSTNSGGSGGTGYVGHADIISGSANIGGGITRIAPATSDSNYAVPIAEGSLNGTTVGGHGLAIITWLI